MSRPRRAVYPGSFDPITMGHMDIIDRALQMCDELVVAVVRNPSKHSLFTLAERQEIIEKTLEGRQGVMVDSFSGLLVNYVAQRQATFIIRGLRAVSDFEMEFQMALMNRKLNSNIDTVFLMTSNRYAFLSSSTVKEVAMLGGSVEGLVTEYVEQRIRERCAELARHRTAEE